MHRDHFWIALGDIHEDIAMLDNVPDMEEAQGVLVSGDLTNRGTRERAEAILQTLTKRNPSVYAQIGNMDSKVVEQYLDEKGVNVHARTVALGYDVGLLGVGYSTPTPFATPSEVDDSQIKQWLNQNVQEFLSYPHTILMAHDPPYGTAADKVGNGQSVGSKAVREFIETHQPDICITGHIHESRAEDRMGKTQIINPGMISQGGYVLIHRVSQGIQASLKVL